MSAENTNIYHPNLTCQTPGLEWIYAGVFGQKTDGVFVEVGAHDGRSWSNTDFLADIGWRGLYIEPVPELADKCRKNHANNNVVVLNAAVGSGGPVKIYKNVGPMSLTTGCEEYNKRWNASDVLGEMKAKRLDDILEEVKMPPPFDLLSIDVEGMEYEVLRGLDIVMWEPKVVVVEMHELNPNLAIPHSIYQINDYFQAENYTKIYSSTINSIFIRAW